MKGLSCYVQEKGETLTSRSEVQQTPPPPKIQTAQTLWQAEHAILPSQKGSEPFEEAGSRAVCREALP